MVERAAARFGPLLRRLRLAAGLSQEELAERAGLSPRGLRALEASHRTTPRPETVRLLAEALALDEAQRTELIAAAWPELAEPVVPGATLRAPRHGPAPMPLPTPPTRLVGREREVAAICALLRRDERDRAETIDGRLVTLTGPGGVGKTRLALVVAHELSPPFDATAWIELAQVHGRTEQMRSLLAAAIARAIGARDTDERPGAQELIALLRASRPAGAGQFRAYPAGRPPWWPTSSPPAHAWRCLSLAGSGSACAASGKSPSSHWRCRMHRRLGAELRLNLPVWRAFPRCGSSSSERRPCNRTSR